MSMNDIFTIIICAVVGTTVGHFIGVAFIKLYEFIKNRKER